MTNFRNSLGHYVENIKPGLWRLVFHLPTTTNCWLYDDANGLTLIDAGNFWNASTILDTISVIGKPLRQIVITHAHPDHAGSAAYLSNKTGAVVFAHEADVPFLRHARSVADLPGSLESQNLHKTARLLGILDPPKIDAIQPVTDGTQIGGLQILHTPGHTPGSISLWCEKERALFVGDNASNRLGKLKTNLSWFTLNTEELKKSMQVYTTYPAGIILPGHGNAYHSSTAVQDLLNAMH
jgi:glyoxylase-like metal-dependent hydrolase (beta-lactamase superfamily II)